MAAMTSFHAVLPPGELPAFRQFLIYYTLVLSRRTCCI